MGECNVKCSRWTASKLIACAVLVIDASVSYGVLYFCDLAIRQNFTGALPYLTTLIGALQAATAVVLTAYFSKSKAENTCGGITYDTVVGRGTDC